MDAGNFARACSSGLICCLNSKQSGHRVCRWSPYASVVLHCPDAQSHGAGWFLTQDDWHRYARALVSREITALDLQEAMLSQEIDEASAEEATAEAGVSRANEEVIREGRIPAAYQNIVRDYFR